jgi:WD40 repeat protein
MSDSLLIDQRRRWEQGDRVLVETYLNDRPSLRGDAEQVLELIEHEITLREEHGETPQLEEYLRRFPDLAPDLRLHFEVRTALQADAAVTRVLRHGQSTANGPQQGDWPALPGYEVLGELGRGGMGVVYKARQVALNRLVALKMILAGAQAGPEEVARFRREAEAVAQLPHAHIVQIYEVGECASRPYLALEYVDGGSLAQRTAHSPQSAAAAARLVEILASAMHCAHQRGIIHRDLKPANVLLAASDPVHGAALGSRPTDVGHYEPKIGDFGLAKLVGASAPGPTRSGDLLGTPSYMAPEQVDGKHGAIGPATDIWALGAILYELLTGRPPFQAESPLDTLMQVRFEDPVSPSRLQPRLPRDLVTICLTCLHKEPPKRYASAEALAADLRRFLDGKPIRARPTGAGERLVKWARRRPAVAASLASMLLVAAVGFAAVLWQLSETRQALAKEAQERARAETNQYFNQVELAHREWLDFNVGRAEDLLRLARPPAGDPWEKRYLERLFHTELLKNEETHEVRSVAISPDGCLMATATGVWGTPDFQGERGSRFPGEVKVWDAVTGALRWTGTGHQGSVMSVAFSPDGQHLASGSWDKTVRIWNVRTGLVEHILTGQEGMIHNIAYSPDGRLVASGCWKGTVCLWDTATGLLAQVLPAFPGARCYCVAFSPDGRQLAAGSLYGFVKIWDLEWAGAKPVPALRHNLFVATTISSLAFSPDGRYLAAGCLDHKVRVLERADPTRFFDYHGHSSLVKCVAYRPDGRLVASSDNDGTIRLWDAQTGRPLGTVRGHSGAVFGLAFSPDGRRLVSASEDHTVKVWDLTTEQESHTLRRSAGDLISGVRSLAFNRDGRWLAISDEGPRLTPWMEFVVHGRESDEKHVLKAHTGWVSSVAFSADGRLLASGSDKPDCTVRLWDVATWKVRHTLTGHTGAVNHVAFSPDDRHLASASADRTVRIWDTETGQTLHVCEGHGDQILAVGFGAGGRRVVSVAKDGTVNAWDAATGHLVLTLDKLVGRVTCVAFSADCRRLAAATLEAEHDIRLWDVSAAALGEPASVFTDRLHGHKREVTALAFSADGERLASASEEGTVKLWDVRSGHRALTLRADPDVATAVAFSPDGRFLATAGAWFKVWEADATSPEKRAAAASRRAPAWHLARANLYKQRREWWVAAFHFDWLVTLNPDQTTWRSERGDALAEQNKWEPALADFTAVVEKQPDNAEAWHQQAIAQLAAGRPDAYRATCTAMLQQFREGPGAVHILDAIVPARGADRASLAAQVERAALGDGCKRIRGAVCYRTGRPAEAVRCFESWEGQGHPLRAWDYLFLAMAQHATGNPEKARAALVQAEDWIDKADQRDIPGPDERMWYSWRERVEVQALRREVEALLVPQ